MGLDSGMTTGVAIIDSNGNVLDIYSKRDMTRAEIISRILKFGNPIIISSDVTATPRSVEKVATKLGCVVYSPDTLLGIVEKRELTKDYHSATKNDHEIDALSAAIKAWKQNRTLFSKVNEILKKSDKQEIFADVVLKIIKEESPNIEDAIREFVGKENERHVIVEKLTKEETTQRNVIGGLQKKLVEKQRQIDSLKNQDTLLSKALNETKKELSRLKERKPKIDRTEDHQEFEKSLDYIKKLRRIENRGYYPIIEFDQIGGNLLEKINDTIDLDSRVISIDKKENLNLLNDMNVKCLLTFDKIGFDTGNLEFPVVQIDKDAIEIFDDIKAIKIDYIEKSLSEAKKTGLVGWLKDYRKRKD